MSSTAVNARLRLRFCFRVARATAGGHIERGSEWVGATFVGSVPPPIDRVFMGDCWAGVYQSNPYTTFGIFSIYSVGSGLATRGGNSGVRWISGCIPLFAPPPAGSRYMADDPATGTFTDEYGEGVEFTVAGNDDLPVFGTALQRLGIPPSRRQLEDYPFVDGDGEGEEFVVEGDDGLP